MERIEIRQSNEGQPTQAAHQELIALLSEEGTLVHHRLFHEINLDSTPRELSRAIHDFIFPRQQNPEIEQSSLTQSNEKGSFTKDRLFRKYDPTQVTGALRVVYDRVDDQAAMSITDVQGQSELPEKVEDALSKQARSQLDKR